MIQAHGTILALLVGSASVSAARAPHAGSYERWVAPRPLTAVERPLLQVVRRWARKHGCAVRADARLHRAARAVLEDVPLDAGERLNVERARARAQRWGWTDGQLSAIALRLPAGPGLRRALRDKLRGDLSHFEVTHAGVAARTQNGNATVVVLLSRRLVRLQPVRGRVRPGGRVRFAGRLVGETGRLTLALERADGEVQRLPITIRDRAFEREVGVGNRRGVVKAELMLDRGSGPEIAAVFPIGVGMMPVPDELASVQPAAGTATPDAAEAVLVGLILGSREAHELPLPAQSVWLQDAARAHAHDMSVNGFFAHVSPNSGDVTDRLRVRGVPYVRALENIAAADSAEAAFEQWMGSPSHRANLLDSTVNTLGVGVEAVQTTSGVKLHAVVVLARLPDGSDTAELAKRAHTEINRRRERAGLPPLIADRVLDRLADRHSREIAWAGTVAETSPVHGNIVDNVFDELDVQEAAADVYMASSVDVVTGSPHARGRYSRAGVGVHRDDGKLWVTVIYAKD